MVSPVVDARRIAVLAAVIAFAMPLALPAQGSAHAVLERTQPARGAALKQAPATVSMTFDEPIESSFGALRVFDARGGRVDDGDVRRPTDRVISTRLRDGLPDGAYTATYRVISADSHPVSGGFVFTVGKAGGRPAESVAELIERAGAGPSTQIAFGIVRALSYLAIALLGGGLVFLAAAWRPALSGADPNRRWAGAERAFGRRLELLLAVGVGVGIAATVLGVALQGATAGGTSFWSALHGGVIRDVLDTRFGRVWELRLTAFGLFGVALLLLAGLRWRDRIAPADRRSAVGAALMALCAAYLVVSPALAGHAAAGEDATLLVPLDVLHVTAMSVWVGGVVLLVLAVPAATRLLEPEDRTRLLAAVVVRFSALALGSVALLLATGVWQSIVHLDAFSDLLDTAFGRAVLIKVVLLVVLIALGAHNRLRSQPALARLAAAGQSSGRAGLALRRAIRAELALMAVVLGVTAALVSYSPTASVASGPYSTSADLGPARVELTVDPARAGPNEVHLYLFDRRTGAPYDRPRELTLSATEPDRDIGPLELAAHKAGPGHYVVPRAQLTPGGTWRLTMRALVSKFEELSTDLEVKVR